MIKVVHAHGRANRRGARSSFEMELPLDTEAGIAWVYVFFPLFITRTKQ